METLINKQTPRDRFEFQRNHEGETRAPPYMRGSSNMQIDFE